MEIVSKNLAELNIEGNRALALGFFDGIHKAHREVIENAEGEGLVKTVVTFKEDPSLYLSGTTEYLISDSDKEAKLMNMGVKSLVKLDFNEVKDLTAEEFFSQVLLNKLKAKLISCGDNYRFGKNASGGVKLLKELCEKNGVTLSVIKPSLFENQLISATRIRKLIKNGEIEKANLMLESKLSFENTVIKGNRIGNKFGFPTANIALPDGFIVPKFGVYGTIVTFEKEKYVGVTNIGVKPTVGSDKVLAETWIQGFDKDIYGKNIRLELVKFIRPERKFDSLEALKVQVFKDAEEAKSIKY